MRMSARNLQKLETRKQAFEKEILAFRSDPNKFFMASCSLAPASRGVASSSLGIVEIPAVRNLKPKSLVVLSSARIMSPNMMKSPYDEFIQENLASSVAGSMEMLRVAMNVQMMRKAGHSKVSAAPSLAMASSPMGGGL